MGSGNLKGRLEKLEARRDEGLVSWRLEDGSEVSFTSRQMLEAHFRLMRRSAAAFEGHPLPPHGEVERELLITSEEERQRVAKRLPWVGWFAFELERQNNPSEADVRRCHGEDIA
jgi:hypothetical protein